MYKKRKYYLFIKKNIIVKYIFLVQENDNESENIIKLLMLGLELIKGFCVR